MSMLKPKSNKTIYTSIIFEQFLLDFNTVPLFYAGNLSKSNKNYSNAIEKQYNDTF